VVGVLWRYTDLSTSYGGSGPPSNTWFLGPTDWPTRRFNPNGILIGSAIFFRAHYCDRQTDIQTGRQTDRQTDRQTTLLGR